MTVLNFEGFEAIGTTTGTGDAANVQARLEKRVPGEFSNGVNGCYLATGADGTGLSMVMDNLDNWIGLVMPSSQAGKTLVIGMRFRTPAASAGAELIDVMSWHTSGTFENPHIRILYNTSGQLQIRRGANTVLETSAVVLSFDNSWYHLEAKIYFHESSGSYDIKLDGVSIMDDTGVDTLNAGDANVDYIRYKNGYERIDDLYVLNTDGSINNDFLGINTRIQALFPDADGTYGEWSPSSGSDHYALVDENPETLSDYNASDTVNKRDTYDFPNISVTSVYAVKAEANMMTSAVGVRDVRLKCISGVTTDDGPTEAVSYDPSMEQIVENIWEADPNTGAAWTLANFNAAEFGLEVMS